MVGIGVSRICILLQRQLKELGRADRLESELQ